MSDKKVLDLKELRISKGVTQQQLARAVNISREYLNCIENGRKPVSDDLLERLYCSLDNINFKDPLFLLIDYVRIRFKTMSEKHVIEDIMRIKLKYMGQEHYGFYGYSGHYYIGDIKIMVSTDEEKGILLELTGKGCRQFECYLEAQGRTWYDFFEVCINEKAVMKRLDLAINDRVGMLNIPQLIEKCKSGECITMFRHFKDYGSGEMINSREDNKKEMGRTLYIGSMQSDIYFCIYEKAYEQYMKIGTPVEESEIKNRFEIRLKNERAENAVKDLVEHKDGEVTAFSIINYYLRFVDQKKGKVREDWEMNRDWLWFIGKDRDKLRLTTQAEPYELNKTKNWMSHQVASSQKMLAEIDKLNGTHCLEDILQHATLNERHRRIIKQSTANIEDIIC